MAGIPNCSHSIANEMTYYSGTSRPPPQYTEGPCGFVLASDGTRDDCMALLITREMIDSFQKSSYIDRKKEILLVDREVFEDADLVPYQDALESPIQSHRSFFSAKTHSSASTARSPTKSLRRDIYERYCDCRRHLRETEYEFEWVQGCYEEALQEWEEDRTKWARSIRSRIELDQVVLRDKMRSTKRLIDVEEAYKAVKAIAKEAGMLEDMEYYSADFDPDIEYPKHESEMEVDPPISELKSRRIERWVTGMEEDMEMDTDWGTPEIDDWDFYPVAFNESCSVVDLEETRIAEWKEACHETRQQYGWEMHREEPNWPAEYPDEMYGRRHSWCGVMV
ncbi:hypothetical protein ACLMJK_001119 [Lecanora helva]